MPLVTSKEILLPAREQGYGVGAFNCINLEYVRGVLDTAIALRSPVIIAVTPGAAKFSSWEGFPAAIRALAQAAPVPVCLHLDHGTKLEEVEKALRAGFSSVMIDASHLPLADNIALTRQVVKAAHAAGVSVEGELGEIGGQEEGIESEGVLTDPQAVPGFVEATGVDVLATSFGSVHQKAARDAKLHLPRLEQIAAATAVPLVLHGGSGVPFATVQQAIARGIAKVNVGTELQRTFTRVLRETIAANPSEWDMRKLLAPSVKALGEAVRERLEVFSSAGKA